MEAQEVKLNRPQVNTKDIADGIADLMDKLVNRLKQKGYGAYASRHEILGILEEEMLEVKEAIKDDSAEGYAHYRKELLDVAVGAIFGYICISNGYIHP